MSTELFQCIQENRNIVLSVYFTVGDNVLREVNMPGNPGNVLAILKLLATHGPAHLEIPRRRNSTYIYPHINN